MSACARFLPIVVVCIACHGCGGGRVAELVANLKSEDREVRRAAVKELAELKPDSPEVRAALQGALGDADQDVRRVACVALGDIGLSDPQPLVAALEDHELSVQIAAAFALLKLNPENDSAKQVLEQVMKLGDGGVIVAVTSQGADAAWAVPTLTDLLKDPRPGIRRLAAEGLGKIGPAASQALTPLERAARDKDDRVREAAANAMRSIQGTGS